MMKEKDRFTPKIYRRMWIPAALSSLWWALSDIADAVVVGQRMGTVGLAAIALILPVYMINCLFAHGLGIGGSVLYSKYLSEGKPREAIESFNLVSQGALALSLLTAFLGNIFIDPLLALLGTTSADGELYIATKQYLVILVSATPLFYFSNLFNYYLRNDDNEKLAGIGSVVSNIADIGLNIFFVIFCGLGTMGAALSTAIGQIVAISIYMRGIIGKPHILQIKKVRPSFGIVFGVFKDGFSESVNYLYQLVFLLLCNNILIRLGNATTVAVFDMIQNASYLILYLYEGTNRASMPILSTYHGEHRTKEKKYTCGLSFIYGGTAGLVMTAFIAAFPWLICALFGLSGADAVSRGSYALRVYCIGSVFAGAQILMTGYYQATEREKFSLLITSLRCGAVLVPATFLFSGFAANLFWWVFPATEIVSSIISALLLFNRKDEKFDEKRILSLLVQSNDENLSPYTAKTSEFCEKLGANSKQIYFVTMTIEEICLAILANGCKSQESVLIDIVVIAETDGSFTVHMRDNATFFNPFAMQTNKASLDDDNFNIDAIGVLAIKSKAKEFFYRRYGGFNSLVVRI